MGKDAKAGDPAVDNTDSRGEGSTAGDDAKSTTTAGDNDDRPGTDEVVALNGAPATVASAAAGSESADGGGGSQTGSTMISPRKHKHTPLTLLSRSFASRKRGRQGERKLNEEPDDPLKLVCVSSCSVSAAAQHIFCCYVISCELTRLETGAQPASVSNVVFPLSIGLLLLRLLFYNLFVQYVAIRYR